MSFRSVFLSAAFIGVLATAPGFSQEAENEAGKLRRLESVTWNPVTHELTWVVSEGDKPSGGDYRAGDRKITYHIRMDAATMDVDGEARRFSPLEARTVHSLMDYISRYAVESTVWWEDGQGEKLDGREKTYSPSPGSPSPGMRPPVNKIEAPTTPGPNRNVAPPQPPRARALIAQTIQK